jgi:hypothetical protein
MKALLRAMAKPTLAGLDLIGRPPPPRLSRGARFRPTPERVLALPDLLEVENSPQLIKHLTRLWYQDCAVAHQIATA